MARPEADPSNEEAEIQTKYNNEGNYTHEGEFSAPGAVANQTYYNENVNEQQPPIYPPPPPPQVNKQAYRPQPSQPVQFPPRPAAYPPQSPQKTPVQSPPQAHQMFAGQAVNYPQQTTPTSYHLPQQGGYVSQGYQALHQQASPYKQQVSQAQGIPVGGQEGWKTELFDCMDDPNNALVTAFFPCLTFGQVAEIVDEGNTTCATSGLMYGLIGFLIGLPCIMSCSYRTKLRAKFGLLEVPAPDWITHCLCECCALCQEYRELQLRGFDPSIGWQGNLSKFQGMQQQQGPMMAPTNQTMMG